MKISLKKEILFLSLILIFAALLRSPTFYLSHNNPDELIHLSLAMKISKYTTDVFNGHYNLYYVNRAYNSNKALIGVFEGKNKIGSLLDVFLGEREDLSHHPPAFPFLLMLMQRFFAKNIPFIVCNSFFGIRPMLFLQWYACILSAVFSLGLVFLTYLIGKRLFSSSVGLLASFFLAFTPIDLLTANKIWADDMTSFFVALAVLLFFYSLENKKIILAILSGLSCGIAALTKLSGGYLVPILFFYSLFYNRELIFEKKVIIKAMFNKYFIFFFLSLIIAVSCWIFLYLENFDFHGFSYHFSGHAKGTKDLPFGYFSITFSRKWFIYPILIIYQFPIYIGSFLSSLCFIFKKTRSIFVDWFKRSNAYVLMMLWLFVYLFLLSIKPGKESRYMLPAYPAIAILSAYFLISVFNFLAERMSNPRFKLYRFLLIIACIFSIFFSINLSFYKVLFRADFMPLPQELKVNYRVNNLK